MKNLISVVSLSLVASLAVTLLMMTSCSQPKYVRDTDEPRLDEYTMGTGLDGKDIERLYEEVISHMLNSRVARDWDQGTDNNVAVFPIRNETSEHIDNPLNTLLTRFERDLVNRTNASVISHRDQEEMIDEVRRQQTEDYNPNQVARFAHQMGAQYFVTGRIYDIAERVRDQRRVQYFLFVQVIETETSRIHFQHEASLTKGLIR